MIDYTKLKELRRQTDVSFALCKKALEETKNNLEEAKKKLTEWGAEKVSEKSSRTTSQGAFFSYIHHNRKIVSLVEIQCETDFVSQNADFQHMGQEIAMQITSMSPQSVQALLKQEYVRDPKKTIGDLLKDAVLKFGENIKIARILRWQLGI